MYKIPRCKTKSLIPQPCLKLAKKDLVPKRTDFINTNNLNSKLSQNKIKYYNSGRYFGNDISNQIKNTNPLTPYMNNMTNRQVRKSLSNVNEKVSNKKIYINIIYLQFCQYIKNYSSNNIIQRTHKILGSGAGSNKSGNNYSENFESLIQNEKDEHKNRSKEKDLQKYLGNSKSNYYDENTSYTSNDYSSLRKSFKSKLHSSISFGASSGNSNCNCSGSIRNINNSNVNENCTGVNYSGAVKISGQKKNESHIVNEKVNNVKVNNFLYFSSKNLV